MNLTPSFASLHFEGVGTSWLSIALWIALTAAGLAILGMIYWGIFQRSERRLTWLLMLLRGAGLFALLLALAKPTWTAEKQLVDAGRVAIVLDNSQSMSLPDASGKSRYVLATEAVARLRKALASGRDGTRLEVELFDITGTRFAKDEAPEQPAVERTDLALALSKTATALRFKPFNGVVLISDGMDNTGRENFQELGDIAAGKPIFTVGFQSDRSASDFDLALKPVRQPPERVMVNNEIKVEVQLTKTGGPATQATVVLQRGLDERFAEQKIALPEGNDERTVSLTLKPAQAGTFEFTATVESAVGEKNLANNSWRFPLRVDAEPIRVLYLEGFLRYEYKFLKTRLEDDPDLNVAAIVRRANPELADAKSKDIVTPAQLKNFDVVILGDMEANYLSAPEYEALVGWLDDKGHALLVLGGYRSFGPDGFRTTKLADVLPVVFADKPPSQSEEPFLLQLTEEGRTHPVFEVSSDRARNMETWKEAPKLAGCSLVQRAKPGAEVLAVNPDITIEGKPAIVVATQRYGAGRTMILAADTTWRWSRFTRVLGQSDTLYARFWSQTLRWLAGRSLDDKRPLLAVTTDHPGYDLGKRVEIRVLRQPRPEVDLAKAETEVKVTSAGGKTITVPVRASSAAPDEFKGEFYPTAGGRYQVLASLTDGGKPLANQATEFLVHGSNLELADTGCNAENLKALAGASGGFYRDVEEAEKLADQVPRKERRITQREVNPLWNSWVLFVVFIGAVSTEWFIRRRSHLV